MKKRSHTLAVILNFFFVLAFFGSSSTNKIGSRPQSPQNFFFPFLFFRPHKILLRTLSLSLSLFFIIASQKEARTQPRARKRRGRRKKRASRVYYSLYFFIVQAFFLFFMCRDIVCFFYRKNKTTKARAKEEGEVNFFLGGFGRSFRGKEHTRKKEKTKRKNIEKKRS